MKKTNIKIDVAGKQRTARFNPKTMRFEHNFGFIDNNGTRQSRIVKGNSIEELTNNIIRFDKSIQEQSIQQGSITLANYIPIYLATMQNINKESTITTKKCILSKLPQSLLKTPLCDITTAQLQLFYNEIAAKHTRNSVSYIHEIISHVFNRAKKEKIITNNPNNGTIVKGFTNGKKIYISVEESKNLLEKIKNSERYNHLYPLLLFATTTGCRKGEIIGLKKSNIDKENCLVYIKGQICVIGTRSAYVDSLKTQSSNRVLKISKDVLDIILNYYPNDTEFVFVNKSKNPWKSQTFNIIIRNCFRDLGYKDLSIKQFRNSFVKTAILNNVPLKVIQHTLGHSKLSTTADIYGELIDKDTFYVGDMMSNIYTENSHNNT